MKGRLTKQIQQINECLVMFNNTKAKCDNMIRLLRLQNSIMDPFNGIKKLFNIDLKILDMDHLLTRKQKLLTAIDDISKLESKLSLNMIRSKQFEEHKSQTESSQQQETFIQEKQLQTQKNVRNNVLPLNKRFPECEVELTSKCAQLLDVWVKNKGSSNQNVDDKFDRLSKIIGILKKNVKDIYEQQKSKSTTISLQDCQQFSNVKNLYQKSKLQNIELKAQNDKLISENKNLKQNIKNTPLTINAFAQTTGQIVINPQESFVESKSDMFQDFYKRGQYCENQVLGISTISDSLIQQVTQEQSEQLCSQTQANTDIHSGILTFSKKVNSQEKNTLNKNQQLNYVENKLKEIKKNRKRITQDDNLWAEMQNVI